MRGVKPISVLLLLVLLVHCLFDDSVHMQCLHSFGYEIVTDILEECNSCACMFRVKHSTVEEGIMVLQIVTTDWLIRHSITEDFNLHQHCCEKPSGYIHLLWFQHGTDHMELTFYHNPSLFI